MKLITTREQIRTVADRWEKQYARRKTRFWDGSSSDEILDALRQLDVETATPEDVKAIIGIGCWAGVECNECGQSVDAAIEIGEEPDIESATALVCIDCLRKALAIMEGGGA